MELKNIDHYVCSGECKTVSEKQGICDVVGCSKKGLPLSTCTCTDGKHTEVWNREMPHPGQGGF